MQNSCAKFEKAAECWIFNPYEIIEMMWRRFRLNIIDFKFAFFTCGDLTHHFDRLCFWCFSVCAFVPWFSQCAHNSASRLTRLLIIKECCMQIPFAIGLILGFSGPICSNLRSLEFGNAIMNELNWFLHYYYNIMRANSHWFLFNFHYLFIACSTAMYEYDDFITCMITLNSLLNFIQISEQWL